VLERLGLGFVRNEVFKNLVPKDRVDDCFVVL